MLIDRSQDTPGQQITRALRAVRRRAMTATVLRGLAATLATAAVCLLFVMAVDWQVVLFSDVIRWALSLSAMLVTLLAAGWFVVVPLARAETLASIARRIERRHPEFRERLSSAVELLSSDDPPELRGSDQLIAALAGRASLDAAGLDAHREASLRSVRGPALMAAGAVLALGLLLAIWPASTWLLARRAFLANAPRVSEASLTITRLGGGEVKPWGRDGVDYVMLAGGRLEVELAVADEVVSAAEIRVASAPGGAEAVTPMEHLGDDSAGRRRFAVTLPAAGADMSLRFVAGDALTRRYAVRVVPRPAVGRVDVTLRYPEYTRRPDDVVTDPGDLAAVAHTTAVIRAYPRATPAGAEIVIDGNSFPARRPGDGMCFEHELELLPGPPRRWSVHLTDEYGFASEPLDREIRVLEDRPPAARIVAPASRRIRLRPNDRLPVAYVIRDDHGLASASLTMEADGRKLPGVGLIRERAPMPASAPAAEGSLAGVEVLDLARLDLKGVRLVSVRLAAADGLPPELGGPGRSRSAPLEIDIDHRAPSFAEQAVNEAKNRLARLLGAAVEDLKNARGDASQLRRIVPKADELPDSAVQRLRRLGGRLASAESSLRNAMDANAAGAFGGLAPRLGAVADEHVAKARLLTGQILLLDEREDRGKAADEVDFEVNRSISLIEGLIRDLSPAASKAAHELSPATLAALTAGGTPGGTVMPGDGGGEESAAAARRLGISAEDWARLPGRLRSQIAQAAGSEGPPEFRSLIRAYFQAVARLGAARDEKGEKK